MSQHNHISIREAIRERILSGEWSPGAAMPGEVALAQEFGCARATVNRALQSLADNGLIERKRRAGTRVKEYPVRHAKFEISIIRHEVEASGGAYRHKLLLREIIAPPPSIAQRLKLHKNTHALHLETVHLSDDEPYAFEDRWINLQTVPAIKSAPLDDINANEWLIRNAAYSSGDVAFSASAASKRIAKVLEIGEGAATFTLERTTWRDEEFITTMKLYYRPGYKLHTQL